MATRYLDKVGNSNLILDRPDAAGIGVVGSNVLVNIGGNLLSLTGVEPKSIYYVDANDGSDASTNDGKSWSKAFLTMAKAFTSLASGDAVVFRGKVREQITSPVGKFDVTIIGYGNRPRHADASPAGSNDVANTWTTPASAAATTPLVTVLQQGWRFVNILFAGPTDAASVRLKRTAEGVDENDGSHAEFINCRFASGQDGIESHGGVSHVGIYGCSFTVLTGHAIKFTTGAGIGIPSRWELLGNRFESNANIMEAVGALDFRIQENTFMTTTTLTFDFTGGARNVVVRNNFNIAAADFDPAGGVTGSGATDVWSNTLTAAIETGLPAN